MQEPKEQQTREVSYQPEPDTVAGFIASMADRVDELLTAANWQPNLE